jgi:putative flippase GtrA
MGRSDPGISSSRAMALTTQADVRRSRAELGRRGFRFALTGGVVALVYVGTTTLLHELTGLDFEASLAIGFAVALTTHFALQRLFVWKRSSAFALPLHHQLVRYLAMAGIQYGVTAAVTATLPRALDVDPELVYLPVVGFLTLTNFVVFGSRIFHPAID